MTIDWDDRFWRNVHPEALSGCWLWHGSVDRFGYGIYGATGERKAHRLAYQRTKGPIPRGFVVRHRCDVKGCVNPDHLVIGTHKDNSRDAMERGQVARGTRNGASKLDERQVLEIRARLAGGESTVRLARAFGVSQSLVSQISLRQAWAWLGASESSSREDSTKSENESSPPAHRSGEVAG
jgi:hypothetical protein